MTTAPRSGGRTTEQGGKGRRTPAGKTTGTTTGGGVRGARRNPTAGTNRDSAVQSGAVQGATALKLNAEQQRDPITTPRLRVAPPAPINAPRAPFIALVVAVVVAGVLGILLINTKTAENSFRIDTLQKQQAKLDTQQQELENEIAANNSPGSLDAAARRLGLVKADNPAYIRLPDGKVFGVPKPGSGEVAVTAQESATSATGR
ncbi:FtsB family cell division protein [Actinoplanes sp. NPDC004185]